MQSFATQSRRALGLRLIVAAVFALVAAGCSLSGTDEAADPTESAQLPTNTPDVIVAPTATATATATATLTDTRPAATACAPRVDWPLYTVAPGDTLGVIASRANTTVSALATANCLADPNNISTGQQLRVPNTPVPPTPYDREPRIVSFVQTSSYPPQLMWVTLNVSQVLLYVTDASGNRLIGTYDANSAALVPPTTGVATFTINVRDMDGQLAHGPGGVPLSATAQGSGGGPGPGQLECPVASSFGTGFITVNPMAASWSRCVIVEPNQTVTLAWDGIPPTTTRVEYYFMPMEGYCSGAAMNNPDVVTSDDNPSDGFSASWFIGPGPCAGVLYAFGYPPTGMIESQQTPLVIR